MTLEVHQIHSKPDLMIASMLRLGTRYLLRPFLSPRLSVSVRRKVYALIVRSLTRPWSKKATIRMGEVGGVPGEWIMAHGIERKPQIIVYLHASLHYLGSPATDRTLSTWLSYYSGCEVFCPAYRLAPEHPFPCALHDTLAVYRSLVGKQRTILAGGSSGGFLALVAAVALRDAGDRLPEALLLFYPLIDLYLAADCDELREEALLSRNYLQASSNFLLDRADESVKNSPLTSPLHGDLHGLPPTLIQVGGYDMICSEGLKLERALGAAGVNVRCERYEKMWHGFLLFTGILKSAQVALQRAGKFVE